MFKTYRKGLTALMVGALLVSTSAVHAATPEHVCQSGRANAAGKYMSCAEKALAKFFLTFDLNRHATAAGKCVTKYAATWPKLVAKGAGSTTCVDPRFVDSGTTVTDQLTALVWEKKTNLGGGPNLADSHDADNTYSWSAGGAGFTAADGTAFTSFLASLNSGGCFAGQCDWRLPTREELLTITSPGDPACTTGPCIDSALGPTVVDRYWSATTVAPFPQGAWAVGFHNGYAFDEGKGSDFYVRAVRAGL